MRYIFLFILLSLSLVVDAQDSRFVEQLDSIYLYLKTSKQMMYAYHYNSISECKLQQAASLSDILKNSVGIFIREYGRGMLSGISVRGTSPSHTQVLWNGIAINSPMNGQTDLNTIYTAGFDRIILKKGGSSYLFGSGGIGGIVYLENKILFHPVLEIKNNSSLGSFNSAENITQIKYATKKLFVNLAYNIRKSKNNYPFIGKHVINENAAYTGNDFSTDLGYKINNHHHIYFKAQFNKLDREMARTVYAPSHSKLFTENYRNLLGWKSRIKNLSVQTDFAYLYENFDYYPNKNNPTDSQSKSRTFIAKSDLTYKINTNMHLLGSIAYKNIFSQGDHIEQHKKIEYASHVGWIQHIHHFTYSLNLRKDFSNSYSIPMVGALEASYIYQRKFKTRFSLSKNYNTPTFNDLYWKPNGNPNLKPEQSYTVEIGEDIYLKRLEINFGIFHINSKNLIKWTPGNSQLWRPENLKQVISKGFELSATYQKNLTDNLHMNFYIDYTFQNVIDQKTLKKIIYTPSNTLLSNLAFNYRKIGLKYSLQFADRIYTTSTNSTFLKAYMIHNIGLGYQFNSNIGIEIKINNLLNRFYQLVPSRPQPGRNYNLNINFKLNQNEKK